MFDRHASVDHFLKDKAHRPHKIEWKLSKDSWREPDRPCQSPRTCRMIRSAIPIETDRRGLFQFHIVWALSPRLFVRRTVTDLAGKRGNADEKQFLHLEGMIDDMTGVPLTNLFHTEGYCQDTFWATVRRLKLKVAAIGPSMNLVAWSFPRSTLLVSDRRGRFKYEAELNRDYDCGSRRFVRAGRRTVPSFCSGVSPLPQIVTGLRPVPMPDTGTSTRGCRSGIHDGNLMRNSQS
jgi:hypothetical protein